MKVRGLFSQGLTYIAVGAAFVLVIMNPNAFVPEANTVFTGLGKETSLLSGSGYKSSKSYAK